MDRNQIFRQQRVRRTEHISEKCEDKKDQRNLKIHDHILHSPDLKRNTEADHGYDDCREQKRDHEHQKLRQSQKQTKRKKRIRNMSGYVN